jgi:hypothetical protein
MNRVMRPLGSILTTLPVGPERPGVLAGPAFEIVQPPSHVLPHRQAAWRILAERLQQLTGWARPPGSPSLPSWPTTCTAWPATSSLPSPLAHASRGAMTQTDDASVRTVVVAVAANLLVAVAKGVAAVLTGSAAMLAETTHSVADTLNEVLLYVGVRRGARPADERHPFGYGQARYAWSLLAAVGIFVVGGLFAIADGVQTLRRPEPVTNVGVGVAVLLVSAGLEGLSWRTARRQLRAEAAARHLDLGEYWSVRRTSRQRQCSWRTRPPWSASRWPLLRWCSTSRRDRRCGTARRVCSLGCC